MQAARTARRVGGGMLGQGGGCHPLAAQKIRRCPLCCLHQRQQQMAGIRLAAPLLPASISAVCTVRAAVKEKPLYL